MMELRNSKRFAEHVHSLPDGEQDSDVKASLNGISIYKDWVSLTVHFETPKASCLDEIRLTINPTEAETLHHALSAYLKMGA